MIYLKLIISSLLVILFTACSCSRLPKETKQIFKDNTESVFRLETDSGSCTAFLAERDLVVTAAHCIKEGDSILHVKYGLDINNPPVLLVDKITDVAILFAPAISNSPLTLSDNIPEVGEDLTCIGYPGFWSIGDSHLKKTFDTGKFRGLFDWKIQTEDDGILERKVYLASDMIYPGDSGGPIFDSHGEVVGLASAISPRYIQWGFLFDATQITRHISIIIPNFTIKTKLIEARKILDDRKVL